MSEPQKLDFFIYVNGAYCLSTITIDMWYLGLHLKLKEF